MVTITLPTAQIKAALVEAVRELIVELGETITYNFHDGTASVSIRAVRKKLREEELVGDYEQGDCRFTINAETLSKPPEKYDEITGGDGRVYALIDYLAVDVGVDDTVLVYKPVGRG
jgi:hypothetical protein